MALNVANISTPIRTENFWKGFWRLADPKISMASLAAMFLGASAAVYLGPVHWGWLALTVLGILAIEVAKNASGEVFDFDSGTDLAVTEANRSPFSGGKRVLVDRLLTRQQTVALSTMAYILGASAGFAIAAWRAPAVLWIGIFGVLCAYQYHAPPLKLSYRGFGELAVGLCYGPLITAGTYLVQRGTLSWKVLLLGAPLGLLIAGFLWINEFPDYEADRVSGKRTLIVRFGPRRASRMFAAIELAGFMGVALLPLVGWPVFTVLGFVGIIPAGRAIVRLMNSPENTEAIIPAQADTLKAFLLCAVGQSAGLWL